MKSNFSKIPNGRWMTAARALEANNYCAASAAREIGWSAQQVYDVIHRMKKRGILTKEKKSSSYISTQLRTGGLRLGKVSELSKDYDADFQIWLVKQVPTEATLADLLLSMAYDIWLDETEVRHAAE